MTRRVERSSAPPPKDCRVFRHGQMVPVSRPVLEGLRIWQKRGRPDLDVILIWERQVTVWLKSAALEEGYKASRKAMAR